MALVALRVSAFDEMAATWAQHKLTSLHALLSAFTLLDKLDVFVVEVVTFA